MYDMCTFGDGIKTHLLIWTFIFLPNTHAARDRVPEEKRDWLTPSRNLRARTGLGNPTQIRSDAWLRARNVRAYAHAQCHNGQQRFQKILLIDLNNPQSLS